MFENFLKPYRRNYPSRLSVEGYDFAINIPPGVPDGMLLFVPIRSIQRKIDRLCFSGAECQRLRLVGEPA